MNLEPLREIELEFSRLGSHQHVDGDERYLSGFRKLPCETRELGEVCALSRWDTSARKDPGHKNNILPTN